MCLRCYVREESRLEAIKAANREHPSTAGNGSNGDHSDDANGSDSGKSNGGSLVSAAASRSKIRPARGSAAKKQLEAVLKTEKEKAIKKYKLKYDKYLKVKPTTNSPFDVLIAATQVLNSNVINK